MAKPDCSELAKTMTQIFLNLGSRPDVKNVDDIVNAIRKDMPEFTREELVQAVYDATTTGAKAQTELQEKLNALKREARGDVKLRQRINDLEKHLGEGTLPEGQQRPEPAEAIAELRSARDELMKQLRQSDPALRQRFEKQIAELTAKLEANDFAPKVKEGPKLLTKEAEHLQFQRDKLRQEIRQRTEALKPKHWWGYGPDVANLARTIMTGFDFSAVGAQGALLTFGHPIKAAKAMGAMFRAFATEAGAAKVNRDIQNRPNAPLYERSGLYLAQVDTQKLSAKEEAFMTRLLPTAADFPGVMKGSPFTSPVRAVSATLAGTQRAYVAFLNKFRADAFDALVATVGKGGEVTQKEAEVLAGSVNVMTGRGTLYKSVEQAVPALNTVFFAPRYVWSRIQALGFQPLWKGTFATRKAIAANYARSAIGFGLIYALANAAGGEVETDPRSSDFLKIRFGQSRLDPLAGMSQIFTFGTRMATGEYKTQSGNVLDLTKPKYGGPTRLSVFGRFLRSKLSPVAGSIADLMEGENVVGEKVTIPSASLKLITPMAGRDIYEAIKAHGVTAGVAMGLLSLFGMRLSTYEPQEQPAGSTLRSRLSPRPQSQER